MDHECGAPAFDNIDDVLAERIVNHSRAHSDRTPPPVGHDPDSPPATENPNGKEHTATGFPPAGLLIGGIIVISLLLLLYRIFHRLSRK